MLSELIAPVRSPTKAIPSGVRKRGARKRLSSSRNAGPVQSVVPVKKSIRLSRLNFPHHLHQCSGRVSAQTPCLMPGCSDATRHRSLDLPACPLHRGCRRRAREPGAPPSTPGPPAVRPPTTPLAMGPGPLGLAVPGLGALAVQSRHRATRHGAGLAPPRLPALLAPEVQSQAGGPSEARPRASPADPADGTRESDVGPPAHSGRTRLARLRGRRVDRRQVHAPDLASAVTHVARLILSPVRVAEKRVTLS